MPSKNKIIAESFQSIRDFLNTHETQLDTLNERIYNVEQSLNGKIELQKIRIENLEKRFEHLEAKLNDTDTRTREVSQLLPTAIRLATQELESKNTSDISELTDSLQKPVEDCVKQSINQDIKTFADALFPVMGPAIRKAIQESFKSLVQTINQTAEQSLSPHGIAWRLEARRKGVPFSEIVLQKTVVFQVEQVFLIHRENGLLIQHRHREGLEIGDSDAISAMLTAIQDFVRDSFSSNKTEELDSIELGDYTVWLERGPYAVLACVIRGIAPIELRTMMRSSLEIMHARYGLLLQQFEGDNQSLQSCKPFLEKTLQSESKKNAKQRSRYPVFTGIISIIFLAVLGWTYSSFQYNRNLTNYVDALQMSPGIVVISTKHQDGKLLVYGMRDPLAAEPLARNFKLSNEDIDHFWIPYQDLTPQFVEKRLRQHLKPPATVSMNLQGKILYLSGYVDSKTFKKLKQQLSNLFTTGFAKFDTSGLRDVEQERYVIIQAIENTKLYFSKRSNILTPAKISETLVEQIKEVSALSQLLDQSVRIDIIGGTDGIGTKLSNQKLAQERAEAARNWLVSHGIEKNKLMIIPNKSIRFGENETNPKYRNVTFKVTIKSNQ